MAQFMAGNMGMAPYYYNYMKPYSDLYRTGERQKGALVGGITGFMAGAAAGAWKGKWLGQFGMIGGAIIGGIAGAYTGSYIQDHHALSRDAEDGLLNGRHGNVPLGYNGFI